MAKPKQSKSAKSASNAPVVSTKQLAQIRSYLRATDKIMKGLDRQQKVTPEILYRTFGPQRPDSSKPQPRKGKPKRPGRR